MEMEREWSFQDREVFPKVNIEHVKNFYLKRSPETCWETKFPENSLDLDLSLVMDEEEEEEGELFPDHLDHFDDPPEM